MKPWAILPVKEMGSAKQRLAPLLSPEERIGLMQVMLRDVLAALSAARGWHHAAYSAIAGHCDGY